MSKARKGTFAGSMAFEEGGSRIDDLKAILARVAEVGTLFDSDGILVSSTTADCPVLYLAFTALACCPRHCQAGQRPSEPRHCSRVALPCHVGASAGPASAHEQAQSWVAAPAEQSMLQVRFMNSNVCGDGITNPGAANNLISQVQFNGMTPLGTSLDNKVPGIMPASSLHATAAAHPPVCCWCWQSADP